MEVDKEDIKTLISILQKLVSDTSSESKPKAKSSKTRTTNKKKPSPPPKNSRENKFESMSELTMFKEDSIIDKQLQKGRSPTPRNRKSPTTPAICRVCGKKDNMVSGLVETDRYKCNKCSTTAG